jgi:hypothetical protein
MTEIRLHPGKLQGFSQPNSRQNKGWFARRRSRPEGHTSAGRLFHRVDRADPEGAPVLIHDRSVQEIYALDVE